MATPNQNFNKSDQTLIKRIVQRALPKLRNKNKLGLILDITACRLNDTHLDLKRFLQSSDFDFFHDIVGILEHIDRKTGRLRNFWPRCARP